MGYDFNGNITSLKRTFKGSVVDELTYSYAANTNKLSGVTDAGSNPSTPNEFFANNANYGYDLNGNLISDSGKEITNIAYNYLNLTQTVTKPGKNIVYTYDAGGQKLKADFGTNKIYDYVAGLVYVNDTLEFIPTAEGRVLPPGRAIKMLGWRLMQIIVVFVTTTQLLAFFAIFANNWTINCAAYLTYKAIQR